MPHTPVAVANVLGRIHAATLGDAATAAAFATDAIFDALRLCNGWAWTYLVVAELVAANEGLGYRVLKFSRFLQTPKIWVYLLILGVIGLGLDVAFRLLNRRLFSWAETAKR